MKNYQLILSIVLFILIVSFIIISSTSQKIGVRGMISIISEKTMSIKQKSESVRYGKAIVQEKHIITEELSRSY